jgi:hypothetical protein
MQDARTGRTVREAAHRAAVETQPAVHARTCDTRPCRSPRASGELSHSTQRPRATADRARTLPAAQPTSQSLQRWPCDGADSAGPSQDGAAAPKQAHAYPGTACVCRYARSSHRTTRATRRVFFRRLPWRDNDGDWTDGERRGELFALGDRRHRHRSRRLVLASPTPLPAQHPRVSCCSILCLHGSGKKKRNI